MGGVESGACSSRRLLCGAEDMSPAMHWVHVTKRSHLQDAAEGPATLLSLGGAIPKPQNQNTTMSGCAGGDRVGLMSV